MAVVLAAGAALHPDLRPPLPANARWELRSAPALDRLSTDLSAAPSHSRIADDLASLERIGPPPGPGAQRQAWDRVVADTREGLARPGAAAAGPFGAASLEIQQALTPDS